jgi:hypothetical protein
LVVLEGPSQAGNQHRFRIGVGRARPLAVWTNCRPVTLFGGSPNHFLFCQEAGDFIADLAGQFLQVDQRASSR